MARSISAAAWRVQLRCRAGGRILEIHADPTRNLRTGPPTFGPRQRQSLYEPGSGRARGVPIFFEWHLETDFWRSYTIFARARASASLARQCDNSVLQNGGMHAVPPAPRSCG